MSEDKPFIIAKEEDDDIIYIQMGGVLNAETLPESRKMVDEIIKNHDIYGRHHLKILVDYSQVKDVDSATIANIIERISEHQKHQHRIALIHIPKELKKLIEIHKMQDQFQIFESKEKALKAFKKPTQ